MKIVILLSLLTAVLGYSYNNTMIEEDFRAIDTNADGSITNDERENNFRRMDVNDDAKVSFVEFHKRLRPGISIAISYASLNIYDQLDSHKDNFYDIWDSKMNFILVDLDRESSTFSLDGFVIEITKKCLWKSTNTMLNRWQTDPVMTLELQLSTNRLRK